VHGVRPSAKQAYVVFVGAALAALIRHGLAGTAHTSSQWIALGAGALLGGLVGWRISVTKPQPSAAFEPWLNPWEWLIMAFVLGASVSGLYGLTLAAVVSFAGVLGLRVGWRPMQPTPEEKAVRKRRAALKSRVLTAFMVGIALLAAASGDFGGAAFFGLLAAMVRGGAWLDDRVEARRTKRRASRASAAG
jgi:hypothetical protein